MRMPPTPRRATVLNYEAIFGSALNIFAIIIVAGTIMTASKGMRLKRKLGALQRGSAQAGNLVPAPSAAASTSQPFEDKFGFFEEETNSPHPAMSGLSSEEKQAWALFDLPPDTEMSRVKKRYNELAKSLHPDHNKTDPKAEEKLKEINLAYSVLRKNAMKEKI
jgi:hypothetical protein